MSDRPATAKIAVAAASYWLDRPYDYLIPAALAEKTVPGVRVVVPFGRSNRRTEGIVLSVGPAEDNGKKLKAVASVLDNEPVLSEDMLRLALWVRERYFCTVYEVVHAMLPAGLWYQLESVYSMTDGMDRATAYEKAGRSAQEKLILDAVFAHGGTCPLNDIRRAFEGTDPGRALRSLVNKGVLETDSREKRRIGDKKIRMVSLCIPPEEAVEIAARREKRAPMQSAVLRLMCSFERFSMSEICYFTGASAATIHALE